MVTIKGIDFNVSFTDADVIERFENSAKKMRDAVADKTKYSGMSAADAIREQCRIMEEYIDTTLECNSADVFFGGKHDIMEHMEICEEINARAAEAKKKLADFSNKYVQKQQAARPTDFKGHSHKNSNHGKGGKH